MAVNQSAFELITDALHQYSGRQTRTADHIMVKCPFHEDGSPSCGIFMSQGVSIQIGTFHCFGCGAKGSWNAFAKKCGFPEIKEWETKFQGKGAITELKAVYYNNVDSLVSSLKVSKSEWPDDLEWRGFSGSLIKSVGGIMVDDPYLKSIAAFFPVFIGKSLKGGVKAAYIRDKISLPYVTTKGEWIKRYGLFLFNTIKAMKMNHVVLVEGPRDALKLYSKGIPAIAILGSNNFGASKALLLSSLMPKFVVCLPDNDEAGAHMRDLVKSHMSAHCKTVSIKLPNGVGDPGEMDNSDIRVLKNMLVSLGA